MHVLLIVLDRVAIGFKLDSVLNLSQDQTRSEIEIPRLKMIWIGDEIDGVGEVEVNEI